MKACLYKIESRLRDSPPAAGRARDTFCSAALLVALLLAVCGCLRLSCLRLSPALPGAPWNAKGCPADRAGTAASQEEAAPTAHRIPDVPFLDQREGFPTGCESVSAAMALQYLGFSLTAGDFIDRYLPMGPAPHRGADGQRRGCSPWEAFPGDPRRTDGWGCYAPVIARALNHYLRDVGSDCTADVLYGRTLSELCGAYVDRDIPVLIWATSGMRPTEEGSSWIVEGTGETFTWIRDLHCLVLTGYDEDCYYFNDPQRGADCAYEKEAVQNAYRAMYAQAVVITAPGFH